MKTFVITANLTKPFADWHAFFVAHQDRRAAHGIQDIFVGQVESPEDDGPEKLMVICAAESKSQLDALMTEEAERIIEGGHDLASTQMIVAR